MSDLGDLAHDFGHGPCTWCGRKLEVWQKPAPPTPEEAELVLLNRISAGSVQSPEPCVRCGRRLERGQPADPSDESQDRTLAGGSLRRTTCRVCGTPISFGPGRGRPPTYCGASCRSEARRKRRAS